MDDDPTPMPTIGTAEATTDDKDHMSHGAGWLYVPSEVKAGVTLWGSHRVGKADPKEQRERTFGFRVEVRR